MSSLPSQACEPGRECGMGWISKNSRKPTRKDCDAQGCILAWHQYQGCCLVSLDNFKRFGNFYSHWMPTTGKPEDV